MKGASRQRNVTPEQQLYLTLQGVALRLKEETEQFLKGHGLTATQFNVLRILRGAGEQALTCGEIAGRLLNKDPDVTRLLERMEKQQLIVRRRAEHDRRVLLTSLTPHGREVLDRLDTPMLELHRQQFQHLPPQRQALLLELLSEAAPG
ncbi:MarR family winged helix-turn-helix transcriptional regulator [Deinococcus wulumuqiensis]